MRGVDRLVSIVDAVALESSTLTEIAGRIDLPKSTALRFLRSLEESGWVLRDERGDYSLGPTLIGMAAKYFAGDALVVAAADPMRALRDKLGETVSLSRRVGLGRVCVQEFASTQNLRLVLGVGESGPLHAGASGVLLYAHLPDEARARFHETELTRFTDHTIVDFVELDEEAKRVRERGWAMSEGQKTSGGIAMAVPIHDPSARGEVVALGLFGPDLRASTEADRRRWLEQLQACAIEIRGRLARTPAPDGS